MDPGAVPGASTTRQTFPRQMADLNGGELGSTCVVKVRFLLGMIPPLSGQT
ncbi:uncharacterized protein METZ01_LOCUS240930 [marine metagenome]|uniref:Uncharacterized protein n=1 Tax=marine metagenome TaxID=408172 RepID=A0A382HLB3_9ZZZZ